MSTKIDRYIMTAVTTEAVVVIVALIAFGVAAAVWNQTHDEITNAIMGLALLSWLTVLGMTVVQFVLAFMLVCAYYTIWVPINTLLGTYRPTQQCL